MGERTVYSILGIVVLAAVAGGVFWFSGFSRDEFLGESLSRQVSDKTSAEIMEKNSPTESKGKEVQKQSVLDQSGLKIPEGEIIYYYGEGCPYCKKFWEYATENSIQEKIPFEKKEVWSNSQNAQELILKANACGYEEGEFGVPFLFTEKGCYVGEVEIRGFFEKILNQ